MLSKFEAYQVALALHRECARVRFPSYLRDQVLRASSSVALNLSEGSAKPTRRDQLKFYFIALGSLREVQTALELAPGVPADLRALADRAGACVYRLCHPRPG